MPTCREVAEQATEYLGKAMRPRGRLGVWAHLRVCPNCRTYPRQYTDTIALARRAGAGPPARHEEDRLAAAMRDARAAQVTQTDDR
jgi:predicted anti-sigma-YlaC factor YlaD